MRGHLLANYEHARLRVPGLPKGANQLSTPGSYDVSTAHRDVESEIQRLRHQALWHWDQEVASLARFGLRDGMAVLELGSGPGFATQQLLELVPSSSVTAVEIDPVLVKRAQESLQGSAEGRLHIVQASVMDAGLLQSSFDFAYARFLFQHLPDPVGAAKEALRVLKPGGKLIIGDIDDAFMVSEPTLPEAQAWLDKTAQEQAARGGNRLIGRKLVRILKEAGFRNCSMEAVVVHTDIVGIEAMLPFIDPGRLVPLVKAGVLSEQEHDALRVTRETFLASDPFVMFLFFLAGGEK
jgi:ubiquinone/menaquinone biosynthesis C-methylase UbiE